MEQLDIQERKRHLAMLVALLYVALIDIERKQEPSSDEVIEAARYYLDKVLR
jgi:hypothetical protein